MAEKHGPAPREQATIGARSQAHQSTNIRIQPGPQCLDKNAAPARQGVARARPMGGEACAEPGSPPHRAPHAAL
eukprot:14726792-Alexandrium_andersonii.AAC.1